MKLFRLLSTTAIAVAALAISASAMTAQYVAPTETQPGKVNLTDISTNAAQKTLLVLNNDATTVTEGDIVQIDQAESFVTVTVGNLSAEIDKFNTELIEAYEDTQKTKADWDVLDAAWKAETEEYVVRVGGTGTIETAYFTAPTTVAKPEAPEDLPPEPVGTLVEQGYGDLNDMLYPDPDDAAIVLGYYDFEVEIDENQMLMGDINQTGDPDPDDAASILGWYDFELDDNFLPW